MLGPLCLAAQAAWLPVGIGCVRAARETTVPVQVGRLGSVRLRVNNATATRASPRSPAAVGHSRRCHGDRRGRVVTRSVTGMASLPTRLVKVAYSDSRPG